MLRSPTSPNVLHHNKSSFVRAHVQQQVLSWSIEEVLFLSDLRTTRAEPPQPHCELETFPDRVSRSHFGPLSTSNSVFFEGVHGVETQRFGCLISVGNKSIEQTSYILGSVDLDGLL